MAKPDKRKASTVLLTMEPAKFKGILTNLSELHGAADEAAMAVAGGYKSLKKQGVNLDALKLVRKLVALGNPAKVAAFLADLDRMRELSGLDAQLNLFEEDKTKPQQEAEKAPGDGKVVQLKAGAEKVEKPDQKPKKTAASKAKPVPEPVSKKALFDEGDGDAESEEISDEVKARQAGLAAGAAGEDYANPFDQGPLRDAFHSGYVQGSESASDDSERATA